MASFLMDDGTMIDTARATQVWHNTPDEDGIPPTCTHLYRHATGTYYLAPVVNEFAHETAQWLSRYQAAVWLRRKGYTLPTDLADWDKAMEH